MNADWNSWVEFAKERRAANDADASIMLALVQRGASAGEAEAAVRSLGGTFRLSTEDATALAEQRSSARRSLALGVVSIIGGVVLLVLLGPQIFWGGGSGPIVSGGMIAFGLFLVGKNVGNV